MLNYGLTYADYDQFLVLDSVVSSVPRGNFPQEIRNLHGMVNGHVVATTAAYETVNKIELVEGPFLIDNDEIDQPGDENRDGHRQAVREPPGSRTLSPEDVMEEKKRPDLIVVDDHAAVREALSQLLRAEGFRVVGQAGSADVALAMVLARRPQLVIVDIRLGDANGVDLCRELAAALPGLAILLYTGEPVDPAHVERVLEAGARGIALKSGDARELIDAITRLQAGRRYVDPRLRGPSGETEDPVASLSEREREILRTCRIRPHERADRRGVDAVAAHRPDPHPQLSAQARCQDSSTGGPGARPG